VKVWIAAWSILAKDARTYYLKPPNVSWGLIFPLAWTGMLFLRSAAGVESVAELLPGVMAVAVLFGTTSLLAVVVAFERRGRSFERLLVAPIPLVVLLLAKTGGAILFGLVNAFVPVILAAFLIDLSIVDWPALIGAAALLSASSAFLGLFIAVSVREVFEAQALSNFFRFPMLFLCGLFLPVEQLPAWMRPLSYALPLTYGADLLRGSIGGVNRLPPAASFALLAASCAALFALSLRVVRRRWIA